MGLGRIQDFQMGGGGGGGGEAQMSTYITRERGANAI